MFINTKHLVITLIAVFIALGLGILIGFQLDSNQIILQQQQELIETLELTFDELTQTNHALEAQIHTLQLRQEQDQAFIAAMAGDYLRQRLSGQNIVIVQTAIDHNYPELTQCLQLAGAQVVASISITDKTPLENETDSQVLNPEHPLPILIADAISHNQTEGIINLFRQGLMEVGGTFASPPDYVILAGGSNKATTRPELLDMPLIRELKQRSIPVIGVESSELEYSYIDYYKKEWISTVDNVDTIMGQTSLVLVLTGQNGNYGIKASANTLVPLK
ncbi:MAG TPA: copper transporter [bacterium]|nr:copper transporter [bacterium]